MFGNLPPSEKSVEAFCNAITSGKHNGYQPAHGKNKFRSIHTNSDRCCRCCN